MFTNDGGTGGRGRGIPGLKLASHVGPGWMFGKSAEAPQAITRDELAPTEMVYAVPGTTVSLPLELFPSKVAVPVIVQVADVTPAGAVQVYTPPEVL
jgi:hypothetical protein